MRQGVLDRFEPLFRPLTNTGDESLRGLLQRFSIGRFGTSQRRPLICRDASRGLEQIRERLLRIA